VVQRRGAGAGQRPGTARQTVAVVLHLLDLDRRDQGGAGKILPRHIVLDRHRLDVEASRFHHPDYLFDIPAPAVERDDLSRPGPILDRPRGQKRPVQRRLAGRRVDLPHVEQGECDRRRQSRRLMRVVALRPRKTDPAASRSAACCVTSTQRRLSFWSSRRVLPGGYCNGLRGAVAHQEIRRQQARQRPVRGIGDNRRGRVRVQVETALVAIVAQAGGVLDHQHIAFLHPVQQMRPGRGRHPRASRAGFSGSGRTGPDPHGPRPSRAG
jgi:hypothetical protein